MKNKYKITYNGHEYLIHTVLANSLILQQVEEPHTVLEVSCDDLMEDPHLSHLLTGTCCVYIDRLLLITLGIDVQDISDEKLEDIANKVSYLLSDSGSQPEYLEFFAKIVKTAIQLSDANDAALDSLAGMLEDA